MEFSDKGIMDLMNGHFSPINGRKSVNRIQFSLCGTPTNLIFARRENGTWSLVVSIIMRLGLNKLISIALLSRSMPVLRRLQPCLYL